MVIEIKIEIEFKNGQKETYFPRYIYYSENNLCLSLKEYKMKHISFNEIENFTIDQNFDCAK